MAQNVQHAPVKVEGQVVGLASVDLTEEGAIIVMRINHTEAGRQVWDMLNDPVLGYALEDEAVDHDEEEHDMAFAQDLAQVINRHSKENASGTPDFVLAAYLESCLEGFEIATKQRAAFRCEGVEFKPSKIFGHHPAVTIVDEISDFSPKKTE